MRYGKLLSAVIVVVACSVGAAVGAPHLVAEKTLSDGQKVVVTIVETRQLSGWPEAGWRWGADSGHPERAILELRVRVSGEGYFVPLSGFVDLGDPRQVGIEQTEAGFIVSIRGGDAGGSYEARLRFSGGFLRERTVRHGEFPESAWEKASYSYNNLDL